MTLDRGLVYASCWESRGSAPSLVDYPDQAAIRLALCLCEKCNDLIRLAWSFSGCVAQKWSGEKEEAATQPFSVSKATLNVPSRMRWCGTYMVAECALRFAWLTLHWLYICIHALLSWRRVSINILYGILRLLTSQDMIFTFMHLADAFVQSDFQESI